MKVFLFLVFGMMLNGLFAQSIRGTVVDSDQNPIAFAEVYDAFSQSKTLSNEMGLFDLIVGDTFSIEITHPEFTSEKFKPEITRNYSQRSYVLKERIQLVEEVVISSERMKVVMDQKDVNIIDYIPFDLVTLALKSHKRSRFLSIEGTDTTFRTYQIHFSNKTSQLFIDCFDNLHLLSEDSAYQVWMNENLDIVSRTSIEDFNRYVRPCVANFDSLTMFQRFSNHNKLYQITSLTSGEDHYELVYSLYDEVEEKIAEDVYNDIIESYYRGTPDHQNVIKLGIWSGDLLEIASPFQYIWYTKIRGAELRVQAFRYEDYVYVLNQHSDSIFQFNATGELVQNDAYTFWKGSNHYDVLFDRKSGELFEIRKENGLFSVVQITRNSESRPKEIHLVEAPFARNIKVHDGWVYFMVKENDFYQINRIYLGKP